MIRLILPLLVFTLCHPAFSQSFDNSSPLPDPLGNPLKFENAMPAKESIIDIDLQEAYSNSTVMYRPQRRMDFRYVKYAVQWPSLEIPEGSSPVSYGRAHFTHTGYQNLTGFRVYSVMNLDLKSIGRGAPLFSHHSYTQTSRNDIGGQFFDFRNRKLFLLTSFQQSQ